MYDDLERKGEGPHKLMETIPKNLTAMWRGNKEETMKFKMKGVVAVLASAAMALSLAACGGGTTPSSGGSARPLTFGKPDGQQTNNSNPFLGTSAASVMGYRYAIYETLVQINQVDPTQDPIPWLATKWTWNEDYTSVTFTIRDGVKWSDGQDLTAEDVAYSFNLLKDNDALNVSAIPFKDVTLDGSDVTVTFDSNQYVHTDYIYQTIIVPEHIWKDQDPTTWTNQNPVGSGPYVLENWTQQAVILKSNPNYWGGEVAVPKIQYIEYNDNTSLTNAMTADQVDAGFVYIANFQSVFLDKDPNYVGYYPSTLGNTTFWMNLEKGPFTDLTLRKAASMIIDRTALAQQGTTGAAEPITSVTGLPDSGKSFIDPAYADKVFTTDPEGAMKLLSDAGYTGVGEKDSLKDPKGNMVEINLTVPAGWSDYDAEMQLIGSEFQAIGAKVNVQNPTPDTYTEDVAKGNFDGTLHWTDSGFTPYNIYLDSMDQSYYKPLGETANYNFGRFQNAEATAALADYANATTDEERTAALATIQKVYVEQVPVIPVLNLPTWGNYSNKEYTGWPSEDDPYTSINWTTPSETLMLTKMKPAK
jgi:peptide/nickel transport system substrate-binding protein